MNYRYPLLIEWLIIGYTVSQCYDLIGAWQNAPLDYLGWLAFFIWVLPVAGFWIRYGATDGLNNGTNTYLLILGTTLSLVGTLASLNALQHVGAACAIAGILPTSLTVIPWIPMAASWMPALGWIGTKIFPDHILIMRLLMATFGACYLSIILYRKEMSTTYEIE